MMFVIFKGNSISDLCSIIQNNSDMIFTKKFSLKAFSVFAFLLLTSQITFAQELKLQNNESSLTVSGTSSLHDWTIDAKAQKGTLVFSNLKQGEIEKCYLDVDVKGLESGKNSMNKNTYKALNYDQHKSIVFNLTEVIETVAKNNNTFLVKTKGNLTISGVTKNITLNLSLSVVGNEVTLEGEKTFKMTDFKIDPPKALLGTITTGDEITIAFKNKYK